MLYTYMVTQVLACLYLGQQLCVERPVPHSQNPSPRIPTCKRPQKDDICTHLVVKLLVRATVFTGKRLCVMRHTRQKAWRSASRHCHLHVRRPLQEKWGLGVSRTPNVCKTTLTLGDMHEKPLVGKSMKPYQSCPLRMIIETQRTGGALKAETRGVAHQWCRTLLALPVGWTPSLILAAMLVGAQGPRVSP
eukprot:1973471-Amphidinium_carterae.1